MRTLQVGQVYATFCDKKSGRRPRLAVSHSSARLRKILTEHIACGSQNVDLLFDALEWSITLSVIALELRSNLLQVHDTPLDVGDRRLAHVDRRSRQKTARRELRRRI